MVFSLSKMLWLFLVVRQPISLFDILLQFINTGPLDPDAF
jgi:hypothetical protein